jgi:FMN phosphatase YigB (HAD superfamily)
LVSNIDNEILNSALLNNQLSFDFIVTSEDCRAYKPRPELFDKALSLLNLTSKEVLHVGDSLGSDIQGAKAMGIPALWINRKNRPFPSVIEKQPNHVSTNLKGIFDYIYDFSVGRLA